MNNRNTCLKEYIASMWPSFWMSAAMAVAVLFSGIFLQDMPKLPLLIMQIMCGMAVYLGLMMYSQKMFVFEIKDMIWNGRVS